MFNFRFILGFAALAFVISLLAGLLGGIPFELILLRTLIGTVIFALLGVGASWVIQRFIPDLLDVGGGTEGDRGPAEPSRDEVDIVIPEENPHARAVDVEGGVGTAADMQPSMASESFEGDEAEFVEAEEPSLGKGAVGTGIGMDAGTDIGMDAGTDAGPAEEQDREPAGDMPGEDTEEGLGDLDSMPSLDSLEGEFVKAGSEQETTEVETTINVMGQEQDPETAAKAIQTWLRRDAKG